MIYFSKIIAVFGALLISALPVAANDFYSCVFNGKEASYHRDEVPRMKSLGAECVPLSAATSVVCSVGSVSTIFSVSEAAAVLDSSRRVICSSAGIMVTNAPDVASSQVVVTGPVAILTDNRPTFAHESTAVVYFRLGSARLSQSELAKVAEFARYYGSGYRITITGHTDSTGSASRNHLLSVQRAGIVRDALIRNNVSAANILSVSAMGEESLRYVTGDGIALGANRAVEIRAYR
jgi:outer membrane protein OmpA-like peptidoglycan-associated protein